MMKLPREIMKSENRKTKDGTVKSNCKGAQGETQRWKLKKHKL